jgi:hypothetical protein
VTQPQIRNNLATIQRSSSLTGIPRAAATVKFSSSLTLVLLTTNQTYVIPPNTYNSVEVEAWGAGGGGANNFASGGGGASGAMCAKTFACSTGLSIAAAVGAWAGQGVAGGATSFTVNGVTYTANGGNPGSGTTGGAAPTATGGDVNNSGRAGANGDGSANPGGGGGAPASRRITRGVDGVGTAGGAGPGQIVRYTTPSVANGFVLPPSDFLNLGFTPGVLGGSYSGPGGFPAGGTGGNQSSSNGGSTPGNGAILLWLY